MANNSLITGPPACGKTTVINKVYSLLKAESEIHIGDIYCPEIREDGKRQGFELIDFRSGRREVLAYKAMAFEKALGKYKVNTAGVDDFCKTIFIDEFQETDLFLVDEIAPIELFSKTFREGIVKVLDSQTPLLAAIQKGGKKNFIRAVKNRPDVSLYTVTRGIAISCRPTFKKSC